MVQHAHELEEEAKEMERTIVQDLAQYSAKRKRRQDRPQRIPFTLHFFTYANDVMNLTKTRIMLQAERADFFSSVTTMGPEDLPRDFVKQYKDILESPVGGGYYLWRYPLYEHILRTIPPYDYFMFLDAGCTILSTGTAELTQWMRQLERASTAGIDFLSSDEKDGVTDGDATRKEIMRFPQESDTFAREWKWTTDRVFGAFNLSIEGPDTWPGSLTGQFNGGLLLARNGPAMRRMLAFVYRILHPDPYIVTDRYNAETRKRRPGRFKDHRHDQSISSITSKLMQNYILAPIMPDWKKPPFGVTRFRTITLSQLRNWTNTCVHKGRDQDEFCDQLALETFEPNTEVKATND